MSAKKEGDAKSIFAVPSCKKEEEKEKSAAARKLPPPASLAVRTQSFPDNKPTVLGSISGERSESGIMKELKVTGSFEGHVAATKKEEPEVGDPSPSRLRAHTAPASLIPTLATPTHLFPGSTPTAVQEEPTSTALEGEEDDEEIKLAMAMALAIQNNPHLTPAEIHELMGSQQQPLQSPSSPKVKPLLIPGRLTNMFATTTTTTATATEKSPAPSAAAALTGLTAFRERARGRFSEMLAVATTTTATLLVPETEATTTTQDIPVTTTTPSSVSTARIAPVPLSTPSSENTTSATAVPSWATVGVAKAPPETGNNTAKADAEIVSGETVVTAPPLVHPPAAQRALSFRSTALANLSPQKNGSQKGPMLSQQSLPRLTGVAWKRRGGMGKYSTTSAWERRRIALQGTKLLYYLLDAEADDSQALGDDNDSGDIHPISNLVDALQFKRGSAHGGSTWFEQATHWTTTTAASNGDHGDVNTPRGFIDLAKEKATVHAAFGHSGAPSPFALSIKVRGETKWKLCFDRHATEMEWLSAISDVVVQCSVDTYNSSLLEAADPANSSEYAVFQPPITKDGAATKDVPGGTGGAHRLWMLEPYRVSSHDCLNEAADNEVVLDDDKPRAAAHIVQESEEVTTETTLFEYSDAVLESDHSAAQEAAKEAVSKNWVIPEDKLRQVFAVVNFSLLYARASSTTIEGFWRLVVFVNLGIFLCLAKHPSWQHLLVFIRGVPKLPKLHQVQKVSTSAKVTTTSTDSNTTALKNLALSAAKASITKSGYMPEAGCTTIKLKEPTDPPKNGKGEMFAGWRPMPGEILAVRSHGYNVTKKKIPSPGELYECVHTEVFESPQRYPDMATRVKLPKVALVDDGPKSWRSPDIFIISIALPTDPPKIGKSSSDGGGYTVTMYYRMKPETRDILRRVTADGYDPSTEEVDDIQKSQVNAVRLLEEWVRRAPTDHKFQSRFKIVPNAHNLKEIGMPSWISKYNGKPFLIKRPGVTGFLHRHPDLSCVEFDVSLHPFPYLAKQAICFMKESYFKKVLVTFGFVIEGRSDDELPECLIGLVQLCYPDPQYAIQAADFFDGTAPRSF